MSDETTGNALMEAHANGAPVHQGHSMGELADDGTNLRRERKPDAETPQADERPEDDGLGERDTLAGRKAKIIEEGQEQARTEGENHAELARLLDVAAEDLSLHKSLRGFSADAIAGYMEQFGLTADDLSNPAIGRMLATQMTADGEASEDSEAEDEDEQTEAKAEEQKAEKAAEVRPSKLAELTEPQRAEMTKHIEQVWDRAMQVNDPVYSEHFENALGAALGTPPEAREALHNAVQVLQFSAQNLMESALPALVHGYLSQHTGELFESYAPGLSAMYSEAAVANTWESVIKQEEFKGLSLPSFGSPECDEAFQEANRNNPWLATFDPPGPDGKPMPMQQALKVRAGVICRLIAGERLSPAKVAAQIQAAVETGKRSAEKNNRRVTAGKALGGGRSTGSMGREPEKFSLMDAYSSRHGNGGL
jgi:hypothetical protein